MFSKSPEMTSNPFAEERTYEFVFLREMLLLNDASEFK